MSESNQLVPLRFLATEQGFAFVAGTSFIHLERSPLCHGDILIRVVEHQQEVESPAGEASAEQPVEVPAAVSLPVEGSIGSPAPLPDTGSGKVSEVEGVDGADEAEAKALLRLLRQLKTTEAEAVTSVMDAGGDCWQDLIVAVEAAIECGAKRGQLTVERDGWRAYTAWDKGRIVDAACLLQRIP